MNDKYVKLADVKRKLRYIFKAYGVGGFVREKVERALNNLPYSVKGDLETTLETADVQPVNQWISVKDRLPDKFDYVLCYCKTTTGEGNVFMYGAYHNDTWWLKTCRTYATLEQPQMRVMYWMPLPEPPKDGEQNE